MGSRDDRVGLDYMLARYYEAGLARFLSADPVVRLNANSRSPQRWNRYVYTLDNPLKYVDEAGEDLKMAPGLSGSDQRYIRKAFADAYATPTGKALIDRLEARKETIFVTQADLGPVKRTPVGDHILVSGQTGEAHADSAKGGASVVVDKDNQKQIEKAGGVDKGQNVVHEMTHVENNLNNPATYDPNDETGPDAATKQVGLEEPTHTPTKQTKKDVKEILK